MSGTRTTSTNSHTQPAPTNKPDSEGVRAISIPGKVWRRGLYSTMVVSSSVTGGWIMLEILRPNGISVLEALLLLLFTVTFSWVSAAFCSALIGFILQMFRLDPYSLRRQPSSNRLASTLTSALASPLTSRTAIVMPVYNEDTARFIAGFESTLRSLAATEQFQAFDFYVLSDTQDPDLIDAELVAWQGLQQRLGPLGERCHYRRRQNNSHRKVGNLADFCQRWGTHYDYMVVLDADSIMSGDCLVELATRMDSNPRAGLIQTIPTPVRQNTFFGRFVQFAANLYSPLLATGFAFWQYDNSNYWGHNAIIRISAFMDCCGLPTLKGSAPFGGEILSHDFVEAALLYRGGWHVYLASDLQGSFEEVPGNILDYATRDRRWAQGNLQHLALLSCPGISTVSRLHFLFGAVAYLSSFFWLCMLFFSTIDATLRASSAAVFFSQSYQLFPDWPIAKSGLIIALLYLTLIVLFAPKIMGCIHALVYRRKQFGGAITLLGSALTELIFAIIVAPLMMFFHAVFVLSILFGLNVKWEAQPREGRMLSWRESWQRSYPIVLMASVWAALTAYYSPMFCFWLAPVLTGMITAPLLIRYSSQKISAGLNSRLFSVPSECQSISVLTTLEDILKKLPHRFTGNAEEPKLPPQSWKHMPIQSLHGSSVSRSDTKRYVTE